ncbi:MAG: OmpH family outer membrane protein [Armatimonadota bacterium]|jgi:Skp family chaperone for outer membrane proteins|nr:OmpH family outer membrane protein [Fimbriimonadaceae bacterium]MCZ8137893.1 OmpH family outer membrane protein [Fimbriimonadaceae bacterium]
MNKPTQWLPTVALALTLVGALIIAPGFQNNAEKYAAVDITKVLEDSNLGKAQNEKLRNAWQVRSDILNFVRENPCLTNEQANDLLTLSLKENLTAAEKTKLEATKTAVRDAAKQLQTLVTKADKTDQEKELLTDLNGRLQIAQSVLGQWNEVFNNDMDSLGSTLREEAIAQVRAKIGEVAKRQGFTMVFESSVLVYSSTDLTPEVVKAVNAAP